MRPKRTKFPVETCGPGTKENRLIGGLMADKRWDKSKLALLSRKKKSLCGMMANKN